MPFASGALDDFREIPTTHSHLSNYSSTVPRTAFEWSCLPRILKLEMVMPSETRTGQERIIIARQDPKLSTSVHSTIGAVAATLAVDDTLRPKTRESSALFWIFMVKKLRGHQWMA